jgi:hypothetical protein
VVTGAHSNTKIIEDSEISIEYYLLQAFMILEGETNEPKRTYRKAECCKECQSKECLHCRCCQKMKNCR